ncbi:MAG: nucleotidyltransferase family protein [Deltaproteobacteria bacterium]|nr:nucleotidyltransferase family protein [Deltaproteobacteria bacterium]
MAKKEDPRSLPEAKHLEIKNILETNRNQVMGLARRHGAKNIRIFGSVARGEAQLDSDIDLLVEMESGRTLLDLVSFWQEIEDLLGRKVDVLTDGGISPYLKDQIYSEAVPL